MHGPLDAVERVAPAGYLERTLPSVQPAAEEPRVLGAMVDWLRRDLAGLRPLLDRTVLSRRRTVRFADLPTTPGTVGSEGTAALAELVLGRLSAAGYDVLVTDLSGSGPGGGPGPTAVKAVVPGLEVETMAYGRIGERTVRRLLDLGRDDLVAVGDPVPGRLRVHLAPAAEERLGGPAWPDRSAVDRVVGGLLPLYREPGRHAAQLALRDAP